MKKTGKPAQTTIIDQDPAFEKFKLLLQKNPDLFQKLEADSIVLGEVDTNTNSVHNDEDLKKELGELLEEIVLIRITGRDKVKYPKIPVYKMKGVVKQIAEEVNKFIQLVNSQKKNPVPKTISKKRKEKI